MSIALVAAVLDHYPAGGSRKLAFVCLAERASDDGGNCWPSIRSVARRMGCTESQARRHIHALIDTGYVAVEAGTEQGGGMSRRYRINTDRLTPSMDATPSTDARGIAGASPPLASMQGDPCSPCEGTPIAGASRYVIDTSVNHQRTTRASSASPPVSKKSSPAIDPIGFSDCWAAYPKRTGGNSRKEALKAYQARLKSGVLPADLLTGVQRYAAYIRATSKEGTAYVKQTATFFGTGEHWLEPWATPTPVGRRTPAPDAFASTNYGKSGKL